MTSSPSSSNEESCCYGPPSDRESFASVLARRQRPRILPVLSHSCSFGGAVSLLLSPRANTPIKGVLAMAVRRWTSNSGTVCVFDCSLEFTAPQPTNVSLYRAPSTAALLAALRHFHRQHLRKTEDSITIGWLVVVVDWTCLKVESEPAGVLSLALRYLEQLGQSYDFPLVLTGLPITSNGWIMSDIGHSDPRPWIVPGPVSRQLLAEGRIWLRTTCDACGSALAAVFGSGGCDSYCVIGRGDQELSFEPASGPLCSCGVDSVGEEEATPDQNSSFYFPPI
ncbi:hypothetical protein FOL46_004190 [Perkinsus olseni]|uniref:Uncharacterized protein n=1 Tax=Perkinsus olseni TaxID=32597 RepID=A0A7J6LYY8_PEROL|nr:hypothetical protein FOL46_004190 [Perkinsus olseni]